MSKAIEQLEQQQSKLEKDNKRLNDTNDMLLEITKKQRLMVGSSEQSGGKTRGVLNEYLQQNMLLSFEELQYKLLYKQYAY